MPPNYETRQRILDMGVIAIVRLSSGDQLRKVAEAIYAGGLSIIEFTLTTPAALEIIEETSKELGDDVLIGAGSVLDGETARAAIMAGAEYIVSPVTDPEVIDTVKRHGKVVIPGAYTPTEIVTAFEQGADFVKVFPANTLGPGYIKAVRAPLPEAMLVPTGGVNLSNVADFFQAGACAVAVGSELVNNDLIERGDYEAITAAARAFKKAVEEARM